MSESNLGYINLGNWSLGAYGGPFSPDYERNYVEQLDSWSDDLFLESNEIIDLTEDLNNWADLVYRNTVAWAVELEVNLTDDLSKRIEKINPAGKITWKDAWVDGFEAWDNPVTEIEINIETLLTWLDDELELDLGTEFVEDLAGWDDALDIFVGIPIDLFDSMFYSLVEGTLESLPQGHLQQDLSDDLNALSDEIDNTIYTSSVFVESLVMADGLRIILEYQTDLSDTLSLDDVLTYSDSQESDLTEALEMSDAFEVVGNIALIEDLSDDMDNWSDALVPAMTGNDVPYLRRYLNDVVR